MGYKSQKKEVMISSEIGKEIIKKELPLIPKLPGVYKMLSDKDQILYVGKAKNLPNRLKSYVSEKNHIIRTERMLSQTRKIEITTTSNESEALLLEANLIKKHKPKFNILLRDDKSFPFIFIGNKDKWSQIKRHRGKKTKEGFYFGPFASAGSANWTIKMIQKIFHLRVCDDTVFKNRERPVFYIRSKDARVLVLVILMKVNTREQLMMLLNLSPVNQERYKKIYQIKWKKPARVLILKKQEF